MNKTVKKILVAVDFSPCTTAALALARDIAQRYDASLTLFHVYATPGLLYPEGFLPASPQAYRDLSEQIDDALSKLKAQAERGGTRKVATKAAEGNPSTEIVREARDGKFDLVVIGTHGHTGIKHVLLGSVAENVVRRAECPVLTVRMPASVKQRAKARAA